MAQLGCQLISLRVPLGSRRRGLPDYSSLVMLLFISLKLSRHEAGKRREAIQQVYPYWQNQPTTQNWTNITPYVIKE